jgi:pyruvate,water dikinase
VVFITASYGLGELVVQGAVNPDEFYVYKPTLAAGKHAILRRQLGAKQQRMVYSDEPGKRVASRRPAADARRFCLSDEDVHELARQALIIERTTAPDGRRVGQGRQHGQALHAAGAPETVKSRGAPRRSSASASSARGEVLSEGRAIGQKIGAGSRA